MIGGATGRFALGDFLTRWGPFARHDLSGSDSETLGLEGLLQMASAENAARWNGHSFAYTDPRGHIRLRTAIAARHDSLIAEHILCCCGAQEAVYCVLQALLGGQNPVRDQHALLLLPIYQPSELALRRLCAVTGVALQEADGWQPDIECIEAAIRPETRLILMNYPNSPTGASLDPQRLDALVNLCRRHGLWLINDEIYRQTEIVQPFGRAPMLADRYERGVSINGLSKGFGLPGLRVGWIACCDRALLQRALTVKSSLSSCIAASSEILAEIALDAEPRIMATQREIALANLHYLKTLLPGLTDLLELDHPQNLAFLSCQYRGGDSAASFAIRLVLDTGVFVLPTVLWQSSLAPVEHERIRLGLGYRRCGAALEELAGALHASRTAA
ncbi:pyridoxal phosphate-dependent aminotransferase [Lichenicola cladoniae]|uniref:Aminotransferase n=1 Tax=Lichenicola cladoniae TaxID=1484109 RepID=A0A6M8HLR1_9PROT|nr:pyridoxal phosphate-dependent aminotransferase [Lichenicola cladoniae]NPD69890.1 pyridoxal phosphate-dependent aminotransferase [Acetobacteraceae bacterium]QKE89313.1 pyridoxal phosphate-dependent aminotransferase [Lichenicola cladoniae]